MIQVTCACGANMQVQDENAGKQCKCPKCGAICQIPAASEAPPAPAPAPAEGPATPPPTPPPPGMAPPASAAATSPSGFGWYLEVLKKYAVFTGRARRQEYWFFVLFNFIVAIVAMILDNLLGLAMKEVGYGPIYMLYTLAVLLPSLAVAIRRLHDIGKSGWFFFIVFIPIAGPVWLLVLMCTDSTPGANQYGPNPK